MNDAMLDRARKLYVTAATRREVANLEEAKGRLSTWMVKVTTGSTKQSRIRAAEVVRQMEKELTYTEQRLAFAIQQAEQTFELVVVRGDLG